MIKFFLKWSEALLLCKRLFLLQIYRLVILYGIYIQYTLFIYVYNYVFFLLNVVIAIFFSFQVHWNRLKDPVSAITVRINTENQFNLIIIRKCGLSTSKYWFFVLECTEEMIRRTNIVEVKKEKNHYLYSLPMPLVVKQACDFCLQTICNMVYDDIIIRDRHSP